MATGAAILAGIAVPTSALRAQVESSFFYDGARTVQVQVRLDSMGLAAPPGTTTADLEQALPPELEVARRLPDGLWVLHVTVSLTLPEVFELASRVDDLDDDVPRLAGPLGGISGYPAPVALPNQFLVRFHDNVRESDIAALNASFGVEIVRRNPFEPSIYLLRATTFDPNAVEVSRRYHESPLTVWAMPNLMGGSVPSATPNDPDFPYQWHLHNTGQNGGTPDADIDAPEAWDVTHGSSGTVVAVIENAGFDVDHPDLVANVWQNPGETDDGTDEDGNGLVDDLIGWDFRACPVIAVGAIDPTKMSLCGSGNTLESGSLEHGTAVAGLIAARGNDTLGVTGVCWTCKLMLLSTGTNLDSKVNAFLFARDEGADVINASWQQILVTPLKDAVVSAATTGRGGKGAPVVFSVFNNRPQDECGPVDPTFASLPQVTSVSATDNHDVRVADTGFGPCLDLVAPGATAPAKWGVTTTDPVGPPGYNNVDAPVGGGGCPITDFSDRDYTQCMGGTSASAAIVSGVAALVLSVNPTLTRQQVQDILNRTADKVNCPPVIYSPPCSPPNPLSFNNQYGYGRVNAAAAVDTASSLPGATFVPPTVALGGFEMGFRAGVTWLSASSGDRTVSNAPGGGPDGEPALYAAWITGSSSFHWMLEAQLGLSFTHTNPPPDDQSNVVFAIQPAWLINLGTSQLYVGPNAAIESIDISGTTTTDTGWGGALGYRYKPIPHVALRFEGRYRWWSTRSLSEWGLGLALGTVL